MLTLLFGWAVLPSTAPQGQKPKFATDRPCYARAEKWRIVTVCQGKKDWIEAPYAIEEFAVSPDGSTLALWKADPIAFAHPDQAGDARWVSNFVVVSLSPGFKTIEKEANYRSVPSLQPTCGTIMGYYPGVRDLSPGAWDLGAAPGASPYRTSEDLLAGKPLQFSERNIFRCSSDRRVVAILTKASNADARELLLTVDGKEQGRLPADPKKVTAWGARDGFSVSPNGKYVAYSYLADKNYRPFLCVSRMGESPVCTSSGGRSLAVSDSGEVIYTMFLTGTYGGVESEGIAYWRPGLGKRVVLEREGFSSCPQWITPEVATRLNNGLHLSSTNLRKVTEEFWNSWLPGEMESDQGATLK